MRILTQQCFQVTHFSEAFTFLRLRNFHIQIKALLLRFDLGLEVALLAEKRFRDLKTTLTPFLSDSSQSRLELFPSILQDVESVFVLILISFIMHALAHPQPCELASSSVLLVVASLGASPWQPNSGDARLCQAPKS